MGIKKKTIKDIEVKGKYILVRVDFNVPMEEGRVAEDMRLRAALPTIEYLIDLGAAVILCSHLGRPRGKYVPELSLHPVASHLEGLIGLGVGFAEDCIGPVAEKAAELLEPGRVLLLENTRFHPGEKKNDEEMARQLASLAEIFVNDAFGSAHRAHASTVGVAQHLPAVSGFLLEKEIEYLGRVVTNPEKPFVAILGGAKISDKINVIRNLLSRTDSLLIGGGMANTFLKAQGYSVAESLVEDEVIGTAQELIDEGGRRLSLPVDVVIADRFDAAAQSRVISKGSVPDGWRIMDVGPRTIDEFGKVIETASTVVWNGPMGVFEFAAFAVGTNEIARAVAESGAVSVVGGGDSAAAIKRSGLAEEITHISTGGRASLDMLAGVELPGVAALQDI